MSISNLFRPGGLAWQPDANNINAPDGALLRADNMVPDESGALTVRRGSDQLYEWPLGTEDVHSLYTYEGSDGNTYRLMGVDDQVYKNPGAGNHVAIWERQFGIDGDKVVNGLFTSNLIGWTAGTGWAFETGGYARHTAGNTAALSQPVFVTSGNTYIVTADFIDTSAGSVAVTLGGVAATGITGATGTQSARVVAAASGNVTLAITPITTFDGAIDSISVVPDPDEASDFEFYTQVNYTGGSWEKDYASSGDVGPVPFTAEWEGPTGNDHIALLVTTLEPVNYNVDFTGTGDIAFGDDHQQSFFARGATAKKFDGKSFMNWGIAKPSAAATLAAVTPQSTVIIACDNTDTPAGNYTGPGVWYTPQEAWKTETQQDVVATFITDAGGTASGATQLTPGRIWDLIDGAISKGYAADTDLYNIGSVTGSDQDIFDVMVRMDDPKHVRRIEMRVDVGSNAGDHSQVHYTFSFDPKANQSVEIRDTATEGANAYEEKVNISLDPVEPKDKPRINTPEEVKATVNQVGNSSNNVPSSVSTEVPAGEWIHLSVTRGQFTKVGNETGRDWETVRQVNLIVWMEDGYYAQTAFDNWVVYSAGAGTLTGTYKAVYRWVRETDRYYELSPPSDESAAISLYANQLKVTIPAAAQNGADDQVTDVWVYIFGGFLDTYYRAAIDTADPQLNAALDVLIDKNEIQILTENERLEPYTDEPRDNIIAIAGPWNGRLFTFTEEGYVYPSLQTTPNLFNTYQVIDLSNQGDPLWMVKTSSGIHCGCERDVIFLAGSGDEDADRVVIDLYPHPLNLGTPPVDRASFVDGNSILYRSADGPIMLASQGLQHIPDGGTSLLWRGQDRHGVSALNIADGRFRFTVDGAILYMLAPEGSTTDGTTIVYRLDLKKGQWSRLIYPNPLLSIFTEPDGTLIAGSNNGILLQLESGTGDPSSNPSVTILTPFMDGGNPLVRKDAFDLQLHCDTNANTATVSVYKDGAASATTSYSVVTSVPQAYRVQAEDVGSFVRVQIGLTGTFNEFNLSALNMTYRVRPQHMTYLDTGYLVGDDPADIIWLQEIEIDANSPSNLQALVYLDDRLYTTETVTVTANVRSVYRVPLPRGTKSRRPRIVVKTTASDGAGEIGFDPYSVRVRTRSSGNQGGARYKTVWPAGTAP